MNILVIFTGGTISSSESDGYFSPDEANNFRLIKMFTDKCPELEISFETAMPYYILSENINGHHINLLRDTVRDALSKNKYDGIIITHGTDTLAYTAAALSYMLCPDIPVVLVSSNYILDDERANGLDNFIAAVHFIKESPATGVYVAYANTSEMQTKEACRIYKGDLLLPHLPYSDSIFALQTNDRPTGDLTHKSLVNPSPVLRVFPYPGEVYPDIPDGIRAILLDTYHSGTLCTEDEGLKNFLSKARHNNTPVYLTGAENHTSYESTRVYNDLAINVLGYASPIAMYMRLWLLYSE